MEGLSHCHLNGIAHRDLKPDNLLVDKDFNLKIADFGFATNIDPEKYCTTKLGTPNYMSPEINYKLPYSGQAADIFAAGVVLFILITGGFPFMKAG